MKLELYLQNSNDGTIYDITDLANGIQIEKSIDGTAGKFSCLLQKDINNILKISSGSIISFIVDGKGIFFGYVFTIGTDASQTYKLTAYDQLRYFKNEEVYVTADMTASDIFAKVCADNELKYIVKSPTNFVPSAYLHDKKTLYAIVERGMNLAKLADKKQYYIIDDFGTLIWTDLSLEKTDIILGDESLVTDYQYEISIDKESYNQIKLYRENEITGKREIFIFKDSDNIKRWGKLQFLDKLDPVKQPGNSTTGTGGVASKGASKAKKADIPSTSDDKVINMGLVGKTLLYMKTEKGKYYTLDVSKGATNQQILAWGNKYGFDLSTYIKLMGWTKGINLRRWRWRR